MNAAFIHIPKNAGNTVRKVLRLYDTNNTINHQNSVSKGQVCFGHNTFEQAIFAMQDEFYKSAFKFCFCRNPFIRSVSSWSYTNPKFRGDELSKSNKQSFLEYTRELITIPKMMKQPVKMTQTSWLSGRKDEFDHIGRVENMTHELIYIAEKLNIILPDIPKENAGRYTDHYKDYYCQEAEDNIRLAYDIDFETFGYSKEL